MKLTAWVAHGDTWRPYRSYRAFTADAGSASRYSVKIELARTGKYRFRAATSATADMAAGSSAFSTPLSVE